jgi:hypothetical protein
LTVTSGRSFGEFIGSLNVARLGLAQLFDAPISELIQEPSCLLTGLFQMTLINLIAALYLPNDRLRVIVDMDHHIG